MKVSRNQSIPWRVVVQVTAMFIFFLVLAVPCHAVTESIATLQTRVSDSHLTNRTSDDIVAFVLMGVLVASVSGMFSKMGCSALGIAGRIGLGLVGAYVGSMVVRVAQIDLGWSEVIMDYEELLFSLLGAIAIVGLARYIQYQMRKKKSDS